MNAAKRDIAPVIPGHRGEVSYTLTLSPAANELLNGLSKEFGDPDTVLRKALALLKLATDARREGKHVGFAADPDSLESEVEL